MSSNIAKVATAVVVALGVLAGCTSQDNEQSPKGAETTGGASTPAAPPVSPGPSSVDQIDEWAPDAATRLTLAGLPAAPAGFSAAEVEALAERAVDIAQRGASPQVATTAPDAAFNYVFANQYAQSTRTSRQASEQASSNYDWEWAWVSTFQTKPTRPARFLTARWQVDTIPGKLGDGTPAPLLRVALSTAIEHVLPAAALEGEDGDGPAEVPLVMQRTIIVTGYKPLGGPEWWPAIGIQANPLLGGKCALENGSILEPDADARTVKADLTTLRRYLKSAKAASLDATSTAEQLEKYVRKNC